jgi:hypothetical protein
MSNSELDEAMAKLSREELLSALFANLIVQQTNMAFMFLGRVPHPETGEVVRELESAKFFIDQIEMLEVKTKGNLNKQEEALLKQSLSTLHMAFVDAVEHPLATDSQPKPVESKTGSNEPLPSAADHAADDDSKKKFSKKY